MIVLPGGDGVALGALPDAGAGGRFVAGAITLRDAVQTEPLDASALGGRLLGLAALATEAAQAIAPAEIVAATPASPSDDNDRIYDRYFGVERAPGAMPPSTFAASAFAAWADVLTDLPEALLGRDEIAALLAGICTTCAWLGIEATA